jgi:nucleotide-binding universal stress UspA family protein
MKLAFDNILWPTDSSPLSLATADPVRSLAKMFGAKLHIVHVAPVLVFDSTVAALLSPCHELPRGRCGAAPSSA